MLGLVVRSCLKLKEADKEKEKSTLQKHKSQGLQQTEEVPGYYETEEAEK